MIIVRRYADENRMKKLRPPLFVYGRRKPENFFCENLFRDSYYFFVKRVGAFISKIEMMRTKIFKLVKEKYYI